MRLYIVYILAVLALGISGCSGLRYVPKEESLYAGARVKIVASGTDKKTGHVKSEVSEVLRPKPNKKFLGMRSALWLYYVTGTPKKEKGFRSWLKNKFGEPPVYYSQIDVPLISKAIDARLFNIGYLDSYSQYEIKQKKKGKLTYVEYTVFLADPYTIQEVTYPQGTDSITKAIARSQKRSKVKVGDRYSLDVLKEERERIDNILKRRGYYYFRPDYLLFAMDTGYGNKKVRLSLNLKKDMPDKAKLVYNIAEVNVFPYYKPDRDSSDAQLLVIDSINYYKETKYIRPKPIIQSVFLRPGHMYNKRLHQVTLSRLNGLGVFKFINVSFTDMDTVAKGRLKVDIYLTPLPRKSLAFEVQLATKSNNFIGPGASFSIRNRNAFKGAELIIYSLRGSFETQYSGAYKGQFTYEINPRVELQVPRLIPFKFNRQNPFVPKTSFGLEYAFLSRVGYFDMNTFKLNIGYKWKERLEIDHNLTLLNVNYYNIYNRTSRFDELINSNTLLRRRFEEQFLLGIAYSFFYNQQLSPRQRRNMIYFNANIELAGNTLAGVSGLITKKKVNSNDPAEVLGVRFAQFARFDFDIREYFKTTQNTMIAARLIAGWGLPYGNSSTLPYAKQFFAGGAYSLRGFQANSVGPGSYAPPDSIRNVFYLQQGGEIKLEMNLEFRFPIFKFLKGAVFADAGNTWLNKPSKDAPNGEFKGSRIIKELAVSTGAGLRVDLNFFVLRFDVGIPLRKPSLPEGNRWIVENLKFKDVVFNLAFGYPF